MDDLGEYPFSDLLRQFRAGARLSQQGLADQLGVHRNTVVAWERGDYLPKTRSMIKELADVLRLGKEDTEKLLRAAFWEPSLKRQEEPEHQVETMGVSLASSLFWNVPYRRNPFFTGREIVLRTLHDTLTLGKMAALTQVQAISGLGGVGKTQTAVEYAYRNQKDYHAVLWARADSREVLISDFVTIASLLKLPEKDEQEQGRAVMAVKRWLQDSTDWLLILDNVDSLALAIDFLPAVSGGHILLTTREQVTGTFAPQIKIDKMTLEEGALFLLRRVKLIAPDVPLDEVSRQDWANAKAIANILDGLPLALDQAGAYIETTACGLSGYLKRYETRHNILLKQRGEIASNDHPEPVATTWSLSFEKVEKANAAAAELLRFCAFLYPDAIPEEVIIEGATELGPILNPVAADLIELDTAIGELRRFSLLQRNPDTQMLTIHRLVQTVLKDAMDKFVQRQWAERAVRAVNRAFSDPEFAVWDRCQRCLPQAQVCADLIDSYGFVFPEAPGLLCRAGIYLRERARYPEAESILKQALAIREQALGSRNPDTADVLHELAVVFEMKGNYDQAESLHLQALAVREQTLGSKHADVATSLNDLAWIYTNEGKHDEAEQLYRRALTIYEQTLDAANPNIAHTLNNLSQVFHVQGKYAQAELYQQRALHLKEQVLGSEHPDVANSLNNLANLYHNQGKYDKAVALHQRALAIREKALGPEHPYVIHSLAGLGNLYRDQGKYAEAEPFLRRALQIGQKVLDPKSLDVAISLHNLGALYFLQGKHAEAEALLLQSLTMREDSLGVDSLQVIFPLNRLAEVYRALGKYVQAEQLLRRALAIYEKTLEPGHPYEATSLNHLALLYYDQKLYAQARELLQKALAIREQKFGPDHPDVAQTLTGLANVYYAQGQYEQAEQSLQRALTIREKALGMKHPDTATSLEQYADLLRKLNRETEV